jgi:phosphoglycolate phosphatase-like HAD superfamily hydrolase
VAGFFDGGIYGALDEIEAHSKERIIQRILDDQKLSGESLLVVGDGSVELREAHAHQALALGVASDEVARQGWNTHKVTRLANAMADLLVADFREASQLIALFLDGVIPAGLEHQR